MIQFINQWSQLIGEYNWYEFDLIKVFYERTTYHGLSEVEVVLLGIGFRVQWVHEQEVWNNKLEEWAKVIEDSDFVEWKPRKLTKKQINKIKKLFEELNE